MNSALVQALAEPRLQHSHMCNVLSSVVSIHMFVGPKGGVVSNRQAHSFIRSHHVGSRGLSQSPRLGANHLWLLPIVLPKGRSNQEKNRRTKQAGEQQGEVGRDTDTVRRRKADREHIPKQYAKTQTQEQQRQREERGSHADAGHNDKQKGLWDLAGRQATCDRNKQPRASTHKDTRRHL